MNRTVAFIKLVRWPNLAFIALTQCLFYYCVVLPAYSRVNLPPMLSWGQLAILIFSSCMIAAGGYIINDYFDVNIDLVNKPDRMIVDKYISRRWSMWWHLCMSFAGVLLSIWLGYQLHFLWLGMFNLICVVLLFVYSISLKRQLLTGNILISLLTAWVIGSLLIIGMNDDLQHTDSVVRIDYASLARIAVLYASFAFIISLIREVVKDMEDVPGDVRYGGHTMPIAWGMNTAKVFVATWLIVLIGTLALVQFYVLRPRLNWWLSVLYSFLLILGPLGRIFVLLTKAERVADYHRIGQLVKVVMLTGILSLVFFKYYSK